MPSKKTNNYHHVKRRIMERYDLEIDKTMYRAMIRQIQNGCSNPFGKQSSNRTVHAVRMSGKQIIAVYEKRSGSIVTVLLPCKTYHF